ncbi:MAG: hypothetical protein LBR25_06155 [Erysipelotrichaceae bacterium]|jgi:ABC-2 type transport system permease protein|nr:hypothetical protein [Erysipelotrichaceae bacterium]
MMNLIKADFYRLVKTKMFYITLLLSIGFTVVQDLSYLSREPISAGNLTKLAAGNSDFLWYFILIFSLSMMANDFTLKTHKNVLTSGLSRTGYYLGKGVFLALLAFLVLFTHFSLSYVLGYLSAGAGALSFFSILISFGLQYLLTLAVVAFLTFVIVFTQKGTATIFATILFITAPMIAIRLLQRVLPVLSNLIPFDLRFNMLAALSQSVQSGDLLRMILVPLFWILAFNFAGIWYFGKLDIK